MPIDLCIWCGTAIMILCKHCGKPYCAGICENSKGEERNPAQPCSVKPSSVARSKVLAAAGL